MENAYKKVTPLKHSTATVLEDMGESPFKEPREKRYHQIMHPTHARSIEEKTMSGKVIWGKKFGKYTILCGSKSEKGVPFESDNNIYLEFDKYAPSAFRVHQLFDSQCLARIRRASEILNSNGLPTEYIRKVSKLESINIDGKDYDMDELKTYLRTKYYARFSNLDQGKKDLLEESITLYFNSADFFSIERDLPVGERLTDLVRIAEKKDFSKMIEKIFSWISARNKIYNENAEKPINEQKNYSQIDQPNTNALFNNEQLTLNDTPQYLSKYLPHQMAQFLARMHSVGLAHGFATDHNWTLAGNLCDLDSVHGKPLGDEEITINDIYHDIFETLSAIEALFVPTYKKDEQRQILLHQLFLTSYGKEGTEEFKRIARDIFIGEYIDVSMSLGRIADRDEFRRGFLAWLDKKEQPEQ